MDRRIFLRSLVVPLLFTKTKNTLSKERLADSSEGIAYVAAAKSRLGECSVHCLNQFGETVSETHLNSRGHSFAQNNNGHIAVIARRPGEYCLILDSSGQKVCEFQAQDNRHFYGHGVFDTNGEYLYLTENDYSNTRGVVGVYKVNDAYKRVAEFESYGVGPHEILLNVAGSQLIIANGGIETHPDTGRKKLNLETMRPSLVFIDIASGDLIKEFDFPPALHGNSIRHMSINSVGDIFLALQNQNVEGEKVLLAMVQSKYESIEKIELPLELETKLTSYIGDVALDLSHEFLAASAPYGNVLLIKKLRSDCVVELNIEDVCAISATNDAYQFVVSSGLGEIYLVEIQEDSSENIIANIVLLADYKGERQWDNHILTI